MTLHWPQLVVLFLYLIGLGYSLAKHGEPETGKHNFWMTLLVQTGMVYVLYCGGFFGPVAP